MRTSTPTATDTGLTATPTPTPTPTLTATVTPTFTATSTATITPTFTKTLTPVPMSATPTPTLTASQTPTPAPVCGNGIAEPGEACDDGNAVEGDGCDSNCTPGGCGNGVVAPGEVCDDGNAIEGDGCDSNCTLSACGNHILDPGEQCDDGNLVGGDGCEADCSFTPEAPVSVSDPAVSAGASVSTGTETSPSQTLLTSVTTPLAGAISISQAPVMESVSGFAVVGQEVTISAPPASSSAPLQLVFTIDASRIPSGVDPQALVVLFNGAEVPNCTVPGSGAATPDPCVDSRAVQMDGSVQITVLTSSASAGGPVPPGSMRAAAAPPPSGWRFAMHLIDAVVLPSKPISFTLSAKEDTVTKLMKVTIVNPDTVDHMLRLTVNSGTCPFAVTGNSQFDVTLAAGKSQKIGVPLTINRSDFALGNAPVNQKVPARCSLATNVAVFPLGGSVDPVPSNNSVVLEVNLLDKTAPLDSPRHQAFIVSMKPIRLSLSSDQPVIAKVGVHAGNGDVGDDTPNTITVSAADGSCPPGMLSAVTFSGSNAPATSVKGGGKKAGHLVVTANPSALPALRATSPFRCTAILSAAAADGDRRSNKNTTKLTIDVVK